VHVVRDGRAVSNSWLQMGWWDGYRGPDNWYLGPLSPRDRVEWEDSGRSFVALAGLGWRLLMDAFDDARALVPPNQGLDIRLEDFMEDPRSTLGRLMDFLGLDWSPQFEAGFRRHTFQASRGLAWKRDLGDDQAALLEGVIARPLTTYGYQLLHSTLTQ
jgi:hypothetical protein